MATSSARGRSMIALEERLSDSLVIGETWERILVFLPGFIARPRHYRHFVGELARDSTTVVCPDLATRSSALTGGRPAREDVGLVVELVGQLLKTHRPRGMWIGGHSRGGQVAWLTADALAGRSLDGIVAIDPVDGGGPRSRLPDATRSSATFRIPTLIVGAGVGSRCAPRPLNHEAFAACAPVGAEHAVNLSLGHADILSGMAGVLGRLVCGPGDNPTQQRRAVAALVSDFMAAS